MEQRRLGNTELELSSIGFGTFALGGGGWTYSWGPQDDAASIKTILRALEKGVNWIDTAPVYGLGHAEEIVGRAIKEIRGSIVIATKCGRVWDDAGNIGGRLTKESVRREVEASLKRLNIDRIDLYQIHWPDPEAEIEEGWSEIAKLVREGKVRYAGVSNFNVEQIKSVQPIHPVASLQPPYSMLRRGIEEELLNFCAENNIGVIVYSPLQKGLLTGKFSRERVESLHPDDHRKSDPLFQEPQLSANLKLVENLRPIAERNGKTLAQLAIAWTLRREEMTAAIVGGRDPAQIEETVEAGDWKLSESDIEAVEMLLEEQNKALEM